MPAKRDPPRTPEEVLRDEKRIGRNLPNAMIGLDNGDIREVERSDEEGEQKR